ncbi:hypothetical protein BDV93DRAFT_516301 [Ceratobasidium sp. AG-I]|nr:hypothetical protein BDV93DRAFT_516301 [Ceratobasidium sp. AG-I]
MLGEVCMHDSRVARFIMLPYPSQRHAGSLESVRRYIRDKASSLEDVRRRTPVLNRVAKYLRGLWRGKLGRGIRERPGRRRRLTGYASCEGEEREKLGRKNDGPSWSLGDVDIAIDAFVVHISQFETGAWQLADGWVKVAGDVDRVCLANEEWDFVQEQYKSTTFIMFLRAARVPLTLCRILSLTFTRILFPLVCVHVV